MRLSRQEYIGIGAGLLLLAFLLGAYTSTHDERHVEVSASGKVEWLFDGKTHDGHGLEVERFGTPHMPKALDVVPLTNRKESAHADAYDGLKDGVSFSLNRTNTSGWLKFEATDLTPLDATTTLDRASVEAEFEGPEGSHFRVVMKRLVPGNLAIQTFGGVVFNHMIHGDTGLGTERIFPEFGYVVVRGLADVYKNDVLIAKNMYTYVSTTQRALALNKDKKAGTYNLENPMGRLIAHLVIHPLTPGENGAFVDAPIPTGIIGPDGKEQDFIHVNFTENISIQGNRFFTH